MRESTGYLELLRIPSFDLFWLGRIVSGLGDMLFTMATMWYVLGLTHSPLATAIIVLIPMITFVLLGIPLATVADRIPKKPTLIVTELARGVIIGIVWLLMEYHYIHSYEIYIANLLLSIGGFLFNPALQAAVPRIVREANTQLVVANALLSTTSQMIALLGYGLGGVIVLILHPVNAVLIDAISFFISGCSFIPISIPRMKAPPSFGVRGFVKDSLEGINAIWSMRMLRPLIIFASFINTLGAPMAVFTVVFSKFVLHAGVLGYGYLETAAALGGVVGALVAGKVAWRLRLWQWMFISLGVSGLAIGSMPLIPYLATSMALLAVVTLVLALLNVPLGTSIQLAMPEEIRGRAMTSFALMVSGISSPIGLIVGGWLMGKIGPSSTFICVGALALLGATTSLLIPGFRNVTEVEKRSSTSA